MVITSKGLKGLLPYLLVATMMAIILMFIYADPVDAAAKLPTIKGGSSGGDSIDSITDIMQTWIMNLRIVGIVAIVFALVLAGVSLGISMGNSAKRAMAIGSMVSAVIGIILVAKAPDIANYFINEAQK